MKPKIKLDSISIDKYKSLTKKPLKYRSIKFNGKHSIKEHRRGIYLKELEKEGKILNLKEQVPFLLQDKFIDSNGNKERSIKIIIDYTYFDSDKGSKTYGKDIVEDVKSKITKEEKYYILKRKLFKKLYPQYIYKEF